MPRRTLVMLTSLRPSSKYRQSVSREEASAFWHGYFALWHPLVVADAAGPPALGSQDEFDTPAADHLFVLPESPYRYHAPDWAERVTGAGSMQFGATPEWLTTVHHLAQILNVSTDDIVNADWKPFAGLGMGILLLEAYCDAQDHSNPLDVNEFYDQVRQAALAQDSVSRRHLLENAAHQLQEAREVVNPSQLYQALTLQLTGNPVEYSLQHWLQSGMSFTVVAAAEWVSQWSLQFPDQAAKLQLLMKSGVIDWWGGHYIEKEDVMLPLSAWLSNLEAGCQTARSFLDKPFESHGRFYYAASPAMSAVLQSFGIKRALGFSQDGGIWPKFSNSFAAWRGPDGALLEMCSRQPEPVDHDETPFHLAHLFHESTASDYVGWVHLGCKSQVNEVPLWLQCWASLHQLAPVFGQPGTLEHTLRDVPATEQFTPSNADDFQSDYLLDLTGHGALPTAQPAPISRFVHAQKAWRKCEIARILAALHAAITVVEPVVSDYGLIKKLLTSAEAGVVDDAASSMDMAARRLANRLLRSLTTHNPGYLVFNPCSFARKVAVHLPNCTTLLPAPALASQRSEKGVDAMIDVPPLGYSWVPLAVAKGEKVRIPRQTIVDGNSLRNDYLIVESDPQTGGLRSIKDAARPIPRLGQQLVFAPGSTMHCTETKLIRNGHAVGELMSIGNLLDAHGQVLAEYSQTLRLWAGKRYVEIDVHLEPRQKTAGYPWHSYFASRWAWRDAGTQLSKSVQWTRMPVLQNRPETQGFVQLEMTAGRVAIFSGGLPFWQRCSARMLDTVLIAEGEQETQFSFAISLDDELPHVTEQDWLTPASSVAVEKGPPTAGVSSWFFHLDAPSVILFDMASDSKDQKTITLRLVETFGYATDALLQCPALPESAEVINSLGEVQRQLEINDEGVVMRVGCYELLQIRLWFK